MTDIRLGARMLAKNRTSTLLIVALLTLGIGATTVMFTIFDAVLVRPLPVSHPKELVRLVQRRPKLGTFSNFPYFYYQVLRDHSTTLASVFGEPGTYVDFRFSMTAPGAPEQISVSPVTSEFFKGLGVRALYGRILTADDEKSHSDLSPAVLSYAFWKRRFNGDPRVVEGGTLDLQRHRFAIIGVMPREFNGWSVDTSPDVRIPLSALAIITDFKRENLDLELAARLKPGVTRAQAQADCLSLWRATMRPYLHDVEKIPPEYLDEAMGLGVVLDPLDRGVSALRKQYADALKLLMASSTLLLLIACANIGGLLLARSSARTREIALRLAMGATRLRIARQILIENSVLALAGAAGGIWITWSTAPLVTRWLPELRDVRSKLLPITIDLRLNIRVLLFAIAVSTATLVLFSLAPAFGAARSSIDGILRGSRSTGSWRGRQMLIAFQIALCTFLLAVACLFVRTFDRLHALNPGFDRAHVATFLLDLTTSGMTDKEQARLQEQLPRRVRQIPGFTAAATATYGVMLGHGAMRSVAPEGRNVTASDFLNTYTNSVSPGYFETMGMRILEGRTLMECDRPAADAREAGHQVHNVVVNQTFAREFFPGIDPIGKRFGNGDINFQIVGVVNDSKYRSLREPIHPTEYEISPTTGTFVLIVRTRMRPESIFRPVQNALVSINPSLAFLEMKTISEQVDDSIAAERLEAALATLFSALAALLAGVGTYGLLAQVVAQRTREIGIRIALGARSQHICDWVGGEVALLVVAGVTTGIGAALLATQWMRSLVYGISPSDPASMVTSATFVAIVAAAASAVPARRAIRIDPAKCLRTEG